MYIFITTCVTMCICSYRCDALEYEASLFNAIATNHEMEIAIHCLKEHIHKLLLKSIGREYCHTSQN